MLSPSGRNKIKADEVAKKTEHMSKEIGRRRMIESR
jgi:hypothetical protein